MIAGKSIVNSESYTPKIEGAAVSVPVGFYSLLTHYDHWIIKLFRRVTGPLISKL
jgi:hypothetical protein